MTRPIAPNRPRTQIGVAPVSGRLALGLMAGTSLDGVDAALVRLSGAIEHPQLRLLAFTTTPYRAGLRDRLSRVTSGERTTAGDLSELNFLVGESFARTALRVCRRAGIKPDRLAVIGSHGQTIFHQGSKIGKTRSSTLQIGEPALISQLTGTTVVADFRTADVAAGGQGAPLVPLVDYLLLGDPRQGTIALNIGGIANLTVIPAGALEGQVFGFDTGPGNMVMDELVRHFSGGQRQYDAGGRTAARGLVCEAILSKALTFPFFRKRPPKSAGKEQFGPDFVRRYFLSWASVGSHHFQDLLRTAVELTARSIAEALHWFVFPRFAPAQKLHRLVISGGGAHNRLLMSRLGMLLPALRVQTSDDFGLPVDAKEAIAFAVLADRTLHAFAGNLPGVTGAKRAVVLGKLIQP